MKNRRSAYIHGRHENHEAPIISVIIPVYNVVPYLREALNSAVNQTYRHLEIIIVDDGSTDGSEAICDEYRSDTRVQVIHQEHRGVSNARNVGLDHATGEYIAFLDPDDAYHPDFIRCMLKAVENADIAECRFEINELTLDAKRPPAPKEKASRYNREESLRAYVNGLIKAQVWNKLFSKKLWKDIRFPDGHNYEDLDTTYRILDLCKSMNVLDRTLYHYRMRPGSITHTYTKKNFEDRLLAYDHLTAFVEAHIPAVFDETHFNKVRQRRLNTIILSYIQGYIGIEEVKAACENENSRGFNLRSRFASQMILRCPWLLKALYPVYHTFRFLELKITGR